MESSHLALFYLNRVRVQTHGPAYSSESYEIRMRQYEPIMDQIAVGNIIEIDDTYTAGGWTGFFRVYNIDVTTDGTTKKTIFYIRRKT